MKIICDSCGTKYSISDDKVRGKVFKIRCKKCSHIVVVRGNESAEATASAPAVEGGWHIVVDGEQVGPIAESDVRARIERGEVRADTYIWKEGFADWLKLSAVPEFADAVGAESAPLSVSVDPFAAGPQPANGAERKSRPSGARGSLFGGGGGLAAAGTEDVFSAPAAASRGADLFASSSAGPSTAEPRWPSSGAPAAGHDGGRVENLTGQRHENSVLFSLSNLQSLAMTNTAAKPAPTGMGAPAAEGSGLIDIRAMAASTFTSPSSAGGGGRGGASPADDLPAFGGFSPAAPVLLPLQTGGPPKWIWLVVALMLGLVSIVLYFGWKVFTAKSPLEPTQVVVQVPVPTPVPAPVAPGAKGSDDKPSAAKIGDDQLPPRGDGDGKADGKSEKSEKSDKSRRSKGSRGGDKEKKVASGDDKKGGGSSAPAPAPDTGPKPAKGSIDDLLLGATSKKGGGGKEEEKKAAPEPNSAGPLSKSAVVGGMNAVKPKINDCYNQFKVPGMAMVNVVIGRSGKVTSATVTGKFAGTPTGACVEKAVKAASFPPSDGLTTPYPFQLR
jgi:predicted Zn finger-like uncharacterized protein